LREQFVRMKYIKHGLLVLFLFSCLANTKAQQDALFSQSYASPIYLSPSFTGLTDGSRLVLNYRDQWPGIPGTYSSVVFSVDHFFREYSSGLGLLFVRDDQGKGQLVKQNFGLAYAYEFEVFRDIFVRPGIQFKYAEQKIDPSKLRPPEDINPDDGTYLPGSAYIATESYKQFDATASAMIYSDFFWVGIVVDHLVKKDIGYTDIETYLPIKTTVYSGYKIRYREGGRKHDEQSVTVAMNYHNQGKFNQLDVGAYWYVNPLEMGLWYRGIPGASSGLTNNDAIIMILGITVGNIRFSYSYDYTLSALSGSSNGTNEFAIMYRFNQGYKKKSKRGAMPCSQSGYGRTSGSSKYRRSSRKIF